MRRGLAGLLVGVALLAACGEIERGKLYNDTSAPIVIRLRANKRDGLDPGDVLVTLKPGQSRTFKGWNLRHDQLPVTVGNCTYVYAVDGGDFWRLELEANFGFPIELQIKDDLVLDLRRGAKSRWDPSLRAQFGFPRRPIAKTCRKLAG